MSNIYWLKRLEVLMAKHCLADANADFHYLSLEESWITYLNLVKLEGGSYA